MPDSAVPDLPFDPSPEAATAWLAGLPVDNSRERCKLLFAGLQALNASRLPPLLHLQVLERMRPMVELESGQLLNSVQGKPLPMDERVRNAAKLSAQFQLELARGFEMLSQAWPEVEDQGSRAGLLHGAMLAYEQYLLRLSLMYESAPSKLWADVHALFQLAAQSGLEALGDPGIGTVFKRLLAFRLACATRLEQGDARLLHELLREHGELLSVSAEPVLNGAGADFAVDLNSGALPVPVVPGSDAAPERRYLFTGVFRRKLAQLMQASTPKAGRLDEAFASRLMVRLGGLPACAPEQKGRRAMVAGGLEAIIAVAAKAARLKNAGGGWAGAGDLELLPLSDYGGAGPVSQSKSSGAFAAEASRKLPGPRAPSAIFGRAEGEYPCAVMRAEIPGLYLLETATALHSGYLAALNTDNTLLQVGVVGASRAQGGGRLYAFELVANDVRPVRVFSGALPAPVNGLLAPASQDAADISLIIPPSKLRNGSVLELESGGHRRAYCIRRLLESTGEFTQLELMPAAT